MGFLPFLFGAFSPWQNIPRHHSAFLNAAGASYARGVHGLRGGLKTWMERWINGWIDGWSLGRESKRIFKIVWDICDKQNDLLVWDVAPKKWMWQCVFCWPASWTHLALDGKISYTNCRPKMEALYPWGTDLEGQYLASYVNLMLLSGGLHTLPGRVIIYGFIPHPNKWKAKTCANDKLQSIRRALKAAGFEMQALCVHNTRAANVKSPSRT